MIIIIKGHEESIGGLESCNLGVANFEEKNKIK